MNNNSSLLIVGCGDLGQRVGATLVQRGWQVDAVRRNITGRDTNLCWHSADYSTPGSLAFAESLRPDVVLTTFTPTSMDIQGYRQGFTDAADNLLAGLGTHRPRRLFMVSSTRVYAENAGDWVDESAELSTTDQRALAIIDAERHFLGSEHPATIVRCAGIYGAPKGRLISRIARGDISPEKPVRYTNRIHREDCAGFLVHLLTLAQQDETLSPVYNAVDDKPAAAHEVESWIASTMGVTPKATENTAGRDNVSHKRCHNHQLHASGYELLYPDYQAGYFEVLARGE
ncbi:MAG: NAD(P)H-binding protein [Halioglobus sp.]